MTKFQYQTYFTSQEIKQFVFFNLLTHDDVIKFRIQIHSASPINSAMTFGSNDNHYTTKPHCAALIRIGGNQHTIGHQQCFHHLVAILLKSQLSSKYVIIKSFIVNKNNKASHKVCIYFTAPQNKIKLCQRLFIVGHIWQILWKKAKRPLSFLLALKRPIANRVNTETLKPIGKNEVIISLISKKYISARCFSNDTTAILEVLMFNHIKL